MAYNSSQQSEVLLVSIPLLKKHNQSINQSINSVAADLVERDQLLTLNQKAATKENLVAAFGPASRYLRKAVELLELDAERSTRAEHSGQSEP